MIGLAYRLVEVVYFLVDHVVDVFVAVLLFLVTALGAAAVVDVLAVVATPHAEVTR